MISFGRWQFDFSESLIIGVSLLLLVSMLLSFRFILKRLFKRAPCER